MCDKCLIGPYVSIGSIKSVDYTKIKEFMNPSRRLRFKESSQKIQEFF